PFKQTLDLLRSQRAIHFYHRPDIAGSASSGAGEASLEGSAGRADRTLLRPGGTLLRGDRGVGPHQIAHGFGERRSVRQLAAGRAYPVARGIHSGQWSAGGVI